MRTIKFQAAEEGPDGKRAAVQPADVMPELNNKAGHDGGGGYFSPGRPAIPFSSNSLYGTGQGRTCQISAAYCEIVRSLENLPEAAMLRMTL